MLIVLTGNVDLISKISSLRLKIGVLVGSEKDSSLYGIFYGVNGLSKKESKLKDALEIVKQRKYVEVGDKIALMDASEAVSIIDVT